MQRHRALPIILISTIFLAVMLTFLWSVNRYWSGVLQPRLQMAAQTHAQVLANAQAPLLVNAFDKNDPATRQRALKGKIQEMLLITDPAIELPFFRAVKLIFDYDLLESPPSSLDIATGDFNCPRCYRVEVPLIDERSSLLGIATIWVTDAYYRRLSGDMRSRLFTELSIALLVLLLVWAAVVVLYLRLQRAKELVEVSDRAKTRFLANVSHELRTPLNAILGYTQLYKRNPGLMEQYGQGIQTIDRSADHLLLMINDILDFSRVDSDKIQLREQEVPMVEFLESLVQMTQIRTHLKDLNFTYEFSDKLPQAVYCDDKRLRQILLNLLNNAVKFTREGQVNFRVNPLPNQQGSMIQLQFSVTDTGPGIPSDKQEEIFLPFHQLDNPTASSEGAGLGLAISSNLLKLMNSRLYVESRPGKGSRFWFQLALQVVTPSENAAKVSDNHICGYQGAAKRILCVDDNVLNLDVIHQHLELYGFEVVEVRSGEEALQRLQGDNIHLVLLDLLMPEMDGFEVLKRIREAIPAEQLPVIAMTASLQPEIETRARQCGFDEVLLKPTQDSLLLEALGNCLQLEWRYDVPETAPIHAATTPLIPPAVETLTALRSYAQQHDVLGLRRQLTELEERPDLQPFIERARSLARGYQFAQLIEWLEQLSD
jgi:signal transduction histidine kinase/CheY-like chemotaxis protein